MPPQPTLEHPRNILSDQQDSAWTSSAVPGHPSQCLDILPRAWTSFPGPGHPSQCMWTSSPVEDVPRMQRSCTSRVTSVRTVPARVEAHFEAFLHVRVRELRERRVAFAPTCEFEQTTRVLTARGPCLVAVGGPCRA